MAFAKNTKTGLTVNVPEHYLGHPILGKNLVAIGSEVQAAPKKEKKKAVQAEVTEPIVQDGTELETPAGTEIEEQPAPQPIINETEELEDGN